MSVYYETYSFREQQYLYLVDSVGRITDPDYAPDGKDPAAVEALAGVYTLKLGGLITAAHAAEDARAGRATAHTAGHDAAVTVYACMKSCYRHDPTCRTSLQKLPKSDQTPLETFRRMESIADRWNTLPNLPGTAAPLAAAGAVTKAGFTTLTNALKDAIKAEVTAEGVEIELAGKMRELDATTASFINAALVQGRSIYHPGTWQRGIIDAIPTEPSTQLPGQAVITQAESPEPGKTQLGFSGSHATSFKVQRKGPGQPSFVDVATVLSPGEFTDTGLAGGVWEYQVVPHNSRGDGPASEVVSIEVIAVGAPGVPSVTPPESQAPGEAHFQFTAEGATEFEVWEKGPGASVFTLAVTVPASVAGEGEYSASGRPPGIHDYKVRAVNAQGPGPFSAVVTLEVLEAAA